jgi:hypothetical protein
MILIGTSVRMLEALSLSERRFTRLFCLSWRQTVSMRATAEVATPMGTGVC